MSRSCWQFSTWIWQNNSARSCDQLNRAALMRNTMLTQQRGYYPKYITTCTNYGYWFRIENSWCGSFLHNYSANFYTTIFTFVQVKLFCQFTESVFIPYLNTPTWPVDNFPYGATTCSLIFTKRDISIK